MADPAAELTAPVATPAIPASFDTLLHVGDLISLGHWALKAIDLMGGPNLAEEVGEWFAGDWSEVSESADALRNLGDFCVVAAEEVRGDAEVCMEHWSGNAAADASTYFFALADRLQEQRGNFTELASQYDGVAFGVKELANAVGSMVESLIDWAIAAGVSLLAAAANSWNPFGWGAAAGAGFSIYKGTQVVTEILEVRAKVWTACEALMGLATLPLAGIASFSAVELPGAYDHRQVAS
ncbi:MAG: hypothetical protein ABIQ61_05705 [Ornithinibacter sp.]